MGLIFEIRRRVLASLTPMFCLLAVVYFGYHIIEGDRGLFAYLRLKHEIDTASHTLAVVTAEREKLERRVALLHPDGLDIDLLDERARATLGLSHPDDAVIFLPE
ncbi:FtsB family cell division protein [Oceanibacterium hippocampi]|uniref:Septum formation initiator n=1 Tax=Oceanibacterium hippocampi TaxID=745714 RepID=A0A1Y5T3J0_9PROT|nr:septum formation initiator family protein [Oceanibacterium hippocampi]SLN54547.1 Septum formation initiator [Oceanibacterium hippocampi]